MLEPTRLYVKSLLEALKIRDTKNATAIHGMVHITGGGFLENIPRILPDTMVAHVDVATWELPALFTWLAETGNLSHEDMATTFNCGIGMAVICDKDHAEQIRQTLEDQGESVFTIGEVKTKADGERNIILTNQDKAWPTQN